MTSTQPANVAHGFSDFRVSSTPFLLTAGGRSWLFRFGRGRRGYTRSMGRDVIDRGLNALFASGWRVGDLVRFHCSHKLALMAHSIAAYRDLGRLVAGAKGKAPADVQAAYSTGFSSAFAKPATREGHTNALQHAAGYFKHADAGTRAALREAIESYRIDRVSLDVPLSMLRDLARRHEVDYLLGQSYLRSDTP